MLYTVTESIEKLKKYCAYQERSQSEVRRKLGENGIKGEDAEFVISELITEGFLNEERFARAFARGKFRVNKWGRRKIEAALKQKGVSPFCIRQGMSEIKDAEYESTIRSLFQKLKGTKTLKSRAEFARIVNSLRAKGFETSLIMKIAGSGEDDMAD